MKQAQFITLMSENLVVEEKTIKMIVRILREAGLFTTGARGVNAPSITPLDAARITVALLATEKPSEAVEMCKHFGGLTFNRTFAEGQIAGCETENIAEDLEHFLEAYFTGKAPQVTFLERIEVNAQMQTATIYFRNGKAVFDGSSHDVDAVYHSGNHSRLQTIRALNSASMFSIMHQFLRETTQEAR